MKKTKKPCFMKKKILKALMGIKNKFKCIT